MIFYIYLLIFASVSSFCYSFSKDACTAYIFKTVTFGLLFIPAALRYEVGIDYPAYVEIFQSVSHGGGRYLEPGYRFLNYIIYSLGGSTQIVIAIMAFLTLLLIIEAFPPKYYYLLIPVLVMTFYIWTYTTLRQIFAVASFYYGYNKFFLKKKYIRFILMILLGYLFHVSALMYIPLSILLCFVKIKRYTAFLIFCLIIISYRYAGAIIEFLFNTIIAQTKYAGYSNNTAWWVESSYSTGYGILLRYILFTIILLPLIRHGNKKEASNSLVVFLIFIFFDLFTLKLRVFSRVQRGLLFAHFLQTKNIVSGKSKYRAILLMIIYSLMFLLFILDLRGNGQKIIPYRTIFQK